MNNNVGGIKSIFWKNGKKVNDWIEIPCPNETAELNIVYLNGEFTITLKMVISGILLDFNACDLIIQTMSGISISINGLQPKAYNLQTGKIWSDFSGSELTLEYKGINGPFITDNISVLGVIQ